ncbi:MAG: hypothetical protein ACOYWZ_08810 [Bacillota bacterium]
MKTIVYEGQGETIQNPLLGIVKRGEERKIDKDLVDRLLKYPGFRIVEEEKPKGGKK